MIETCLHVFILFDSINLLKHIHTKNTMGVDASELLQLQQQLANEQIEVINNKRVQVERIVNAIRIKMLAGVAAAEEIDGDHDPWDENAEGAGWLDNEIGYFEELYTIIDANNQPINFITAGTVLAGIDLLCNKSDDFLQLLERFIELNGTDAEGVFELRDGNADDIRAYFLHEN